MPAIPNIHGYPLFQVKQTAEDLYHLCVAGVFTFVLAEFACRAVERPRFGDLDAHKLDDDIQWRHAREVVGEMCADTEGGYA